MLLFVLSPNVGRPLSLTYVNRGESPHPEDVFAFCSSERLVHQLCWEREQPCFQTLPHFLLITARTLPIKTCRFPPHKGCAPTTWRQAVPSSAGPQPALLGLSPQREQELETSVLTPKTVFFLRSPGEHVFIDSSLTNINPPASCLLWNEVKWRSVNINN